MPRENSKCRKWEKERRERINQAFTHLAKQLPCYDPSVSICKVDILQNAASSIQELQKKVEKLTSSDGQKKTEMEDIIKKLQDRIKKLLVRNEQLSNLLRDAGISVPSVCGTIKKIKKQHPWSKRISAERAELIRKNEMEKENICSKFDHEKKKKTKTVNAGVAQKSRTVIVNRVKQKGTYPKIKRKYKKQQPSNCLILLSQPAGIRGDFSQQWFLIMNQPSNNMHKNTVKTDINGIGMVSKPLILSPKSKTTKNLFQINPSITSLGPGTLLLGNGTIMSVLPQSQTLLPTLSNLFMNSAVNAFSKNLKTQENKSKGNSVPKTNSQINIQNSNIKTVPTIKPKHCLTKTTQVNKVPIPALTSRYANNYHLLNETNTKHVKPKEILKAKKPNRTEQIEESNKTNKRTDKRKNEFETETESNVKKAKGDCRTDPSNEKVDENTSANTNNAPILSAEKSDKNSLNITDKENLKNEGNSLTKEPITNEREGNRDVEDNPSNKNIESDGIRETENINSAEVFEKHQETLENVNNVNPQEALTISTTEMATTVTTTTTHNVIKNLDLNLGHSELSNDIFASLQVPSGCQNPESTSPTAAFLLAFPLVSSGVKVTEVIDEENSESQRGTPTLLQIGTMDSTKATHTQSQPETITPNLMNLDNFSFFPTKDVCGSFFNNYSGTVSKANKVSVSSTTLNTSNNSDIALNKSIYVNVKSPSLPSCVAEPIKENYNPYGLKIGNSSKEIISNTDNCCRKNNNAKISDNVVFNLQSNSKINSNYPVHSKDQTHKSSDQKSHYMPPPYSNSTCNFNYRGDTTKMCNTCSYVNINRNYANPLYTNCSNYSYNYHADSNLNQNYYKNIHRNETKAYYPLNYDNYSDFRKSENTFTGGYYEPSYGKERKNNAPKVKTTSQNKLPINWMTTPDSRLQNSECLLSSFPKSDFSQTYPFSSYVTSSSTCFTATSTNTNDASCTMETKKSLDITPTVSVNSHQRLDTEEKQFSWSPTKLPHFLDHPHNFVTSTLPTLVGDLALPFGEQKNEYKYLKVNKDVMKTNKISNYENQSNFLSVSQLVEHNKSECIPAKTTTRRNSGNRSKNNVQQKAKRSTKQENKDLLSNCGINNDKIGQRVSVNCNILSNNEILSEQKNRNATKNTASNYSAEALIGNQVPDDSINKRYLPPTSKSLGMTGFLTENIISYFPPADLPQENYMPQNQSYQTNNFGHNLCTCQNNTYSANSFMYTASTITSTYLATNNFDSGPHDCLQDNLISNVTTKDKQYNIKNFNNRQPNKDEKSNHTSANLNNLKKPKKKQPSDSNTGLISFEFPFLSVPGSNNSPILPDDFHSHTNFLPPTTPFSCKNSLYPKQNNDLSSGSILPLHPISRSNTQHPEISPSIGTSLTNFNLSTIFPEINKGTMTEMFPDSRIKEQPHSKTCTSTSPQVPFNTEPKFSFSA